MISTNLEIILNNAIRFANERKHEFLTLESVLLAMLEDEFVHSVLKDCGANTDHLKQALEDFLNEKTHFSILTEEEIEQLNISQFANDRLREIASENGIKYQPEISQALQRVMQRSALHVQSSGKKAIQAVNLLVAIFSEKDSHAVYYLEKEGVTRIQVIEKIAHTGDKAQTSQPTEKKESKENLKREEKYEKALREFTVNLNESAKLGQIDPVIGRESEISRMIQILSRRRKNNPILVGDAGVGKTAIAEGLALKITEGKVPSELQDAIVYSLDMASLMAGTKFRGDFEERLKLVVEAMTDDKKSGKKRILFIDEIHTIIGAGSTTGGSLDASNLLKPALSKGLLRCIGSTTFDEYRKVFEKDHALTRRFQKIDVNEPSLSESVQIIEGLKEKFELHHGVKYPSEVIKHAVELSNKHIHDRKLPDKAIDIIDEVGAMVKLDLKRLEEREIKIQDIEAVVASLARIPERNVSMKEKDRLKSLERDLKLLIFGQDAAIEKVSNAILMSRSGLRDDVKPVASFLFIGPTGVGKTELAKQLASTMGINFLRLDMSEYMEKHSVAKLIGAPPGYVGFDQGGILTEKINQTPYTILLLDEIEKAHPDLYNILLQIMDHGKLTDSNGRTTDFRNVILIMTSNAGAKDYEAGSIGFAQNAQENPVKRDQSIKNTFSPEFRNRLDGIVHFNKLAIANINKVVEKLLMELENQLLSKSIDLQYTNEVITFIADQAYDSKLGARPIARFIDEHVKKKLAHEILFGNLENGGIVELEIHDKEIKCKISPRAENKLSSKIETL
ncbi:MAG: ATP-dependent Clp protease ATP-binding subunit ClpA [Bacteriovoracaceae bacterium]|nr:ATP-dependent Clp protease ATP-binding subunit ClpA [Bacteriovoracaceae bacterium]